MDTSSSWIDIQGGEDRFGAYLARPRGGNGPGIVLLQEIFGVNSHIRNVADQYAADGYVVLAPDLFWRHAPRIELGYDDADWQRAVALKNATDVEQAQQDIGHAVRTLRALPGVQGKLGAIGFCFGGLLAYHTAANGHVDVAVAYYGGGIQNALARARQIHIPLQLHFGALDAHIPADAVARIANAFDDNDAVEIHVYDQAQHGFNCNHRASYQQRAAAQAHGNTLLFLGEHL
jgi:carboxymethylenebutenolidase